MKSALIIGGGISGLGAAVHLLGHGWKVTLIEAKPAFGGRISTSRMLSIPVELGAEFVHGNNAALANAISAARLSLKKVSDQNQIYRDNKLVQVEIWTLVSEIIRQIDIRRPDGPFSQFIDSADVPTEDGRLATAFVEGFNAADSRLISAHALRRAEFASERSGGSKQARLEQGYSALIGHFVADVTARGGVLLNCAEGRLLKWRRGHVELAFERNSVTEYLQADAAVITLPLGALKEASLKFHPALTHKRDAIYGLQFGNVVKLGLLFKEVWWPQQDFGFAHSLHEPLPTWWSHSNGPLLTGWAGGPNPT